MDAAQTISEAFWTAMAAVLPTGSAAIVTIPGSENISAFKKALYRAPADSPQMGLDFLVPQSKPAVRTFGMNRADDNSDYPYAQRYTYSLWIKNKKGGSSDLTALLGIIQKGLAAVYPHLGVTAFPVTDFSLEPGRGQRGSSNALTMTLVVLCRPMRSQLTA